MKIKRKKKTTTLIPNSIKKDDRVVFFNAANKSRPLSFCTVSNVSGNVMLLQAFDPAEAFVVDAQDAQRLVMKVTDQHEALSAYKRLYECFVNICSTMDFSGEVDLGSAQRVAGVPAESEAEATFDPLNGEEVLATPTTVNPRASHEPPGEDLVRDAWCRVHVQRVTKKLRPCTIGRNLYGRIKSNRDGWVGIEIRDLTGKYLRTRFEVSRVTRVPVSSVPSRVWNLFNL